MPLTSDDVERIAEAVWRRATVNGFGATVAAEQILNGAEKRTAEILADVDSLRAEVGQLRNRGAG